MKLLLRKLFSYQFTLMEFYLYLCYLLDYATDMHSFVVHPNIGFS